MIDNFQSINVFAPTVSEIIVSILLSLICSFFITFIYKISYQGPGYSNSFVNSIIFLSLITTLVIMVIGNNLARAFGLVGAMSIIRFRTAIKDTLDIVYIFLGLAIGMAVGVGYYKLAIVGSLMIGTILFIFSKTGFFSLKKTQYLLHFDSFLGKDKEKQYLTVIEKYCRSYEMINIKSLDMQNMAEYSFYVTLKKNVTGNELIEEMVKLGDIKNVNIFFDEEHL